MTDTINTETPDAASTVETPPQTTTTSTVETIQVKAPTPATPQSVLADSAYLASLTAEYEQHGDLTPETYAKLATAGVSRELVSDYVQSKLAAAELESYRAQAVTQKVYEACGGKDAVDAACAWAQANLSPAVVDALNAQLRSPDADVVATVIQGLQARARSSGSFVAGASGGTGVNVFQSEKEWQAALADPKYSKDPQYRAAVDAQMALSVKLGKISLANISTR